VLAAAAARQLCPNDPDIRRLTAGRQRFTERLILFNIRTTKEADVFLLPTKSPL